MGAKVLGWDHGWQATPQAVPQREWVAFSPQPSRSKRPWWSPTSVVAVLVEANEDVVSMQLLLSKFEKDCKAEGPCQDLPAHPSPGPGDPQHPSAREPTGTSCPLWRTILGTEGIEHPRPHLLNIRNTHRSPQL